MPRRNLTKWENVRGKMEWRSGTDGYGELQIVRSERTRPFQYLLMTRPYTGNGLVLSSHGSFAAAKKAGEAYARKLHAPKGNPMPKRKATAAQLRNLAKGRKKLAAMRRAGTVTRKKATRATRPTRRNPCVPAAHPNPVQRFFSTIRLAAPNDSNGNPRRLFLTLKGGEPVGVFDEGYEGKAAITDKKMRDAYGGISIAISAAEYRDWLKTYRSGAIKGVKHNPAYGNFMTARNVLRTGRTTNPKRRSYSGGIPPGTKGRALHNVIASIDPRSGRTVWWGAFGWGPDKKAVTFTDVKNAKYVANKMKRPVVIAKEFTSAHELGKVLRGES